MQQDPIAQFRLWYADAQATQHPLPEAMSLATSDAAGRPASRMVLLREFDTQGFVFYTNYQSRKAEELTRQPWAALLFWWPALERQVRIEGQVERISAAQSDTYFAGRPRGSQLGAWASEQSRVISGRAELEQRMAHYSTRYADGPVPRPPHWGGYRLVPEYLEFWHGRPDRLHERLRYTRTASAPTQSWRLEVLAP